MRPRHALPAIALTIASIASAAFAAPPDWGTPTIKRPTNTPPADNALSVTVRQTERHHVWKQMPGCARDIAGGAKGVVYVTGCDVAPNSRGSSPFYRWNGSAFDRLPVDGLGSAIATHAFYSYTVGTDALLYSRAGEGKWDRRGTPDGQPITDVGAGKGGLWVVTSRPKGEGGNAIARAMPCTGSGQLIDKDFCGWEEMPGAAVRISVGATAWVVNAQGGIYEWRESGGGYWEEHAGCFRDVGANGNAVYAVACSGGDGDGTAIYRWTDSGWTDMRVSGKRVGVDAAGQVWVVTDSGKILRR